MYDFYNYNLADQQTVMRRCEKVDLQTMEKQINSMILENALKLPTYQSEYKFAKIKDWNTKFRQTQVSSQNKKRLRQRERGVKPPDGRWLSTDFTLKPIYLNSYEDYIETDHPMSSNQESNYSSRSNIDFT